MNYLKFIASKFFDSIKMLRLGKKKVAKEKFYVAQRTIIILGSYW